MLKLELLIALLNLITSLAKLAKACVLAWHINV